MDEINNILKSLNNGDLNIKKKDNKVKVYSMLTGLYRILYIYLNDNRLVTGANKKKDF